jgi:hypothetical protein
MIPGVNVNQLSDETGYTPLQMALQTHLLSYKFVNNQVLKELNNIISFDCVYNLMGSFLAHDEYKPNILSQSSLHKGKVDKPTSMLGMSILHMICSEQLTKFTHDQQLLLLSVLLADRNKLNINLQVNYDHCKHKVDRDKHSLEGMSPLMLAIHNGLFSATSMLLKKKNIDLNLTTKNGNNSALHILFSTSKFDDFVKYIVLEKMIKHKPLITQNDDGKDPLMFLKDDIQNSSECYLKCCQLLLKYVSDNPKYLEEGLLEPRERLLKLTSDQDDSNNLLPKLGP